MLREAFRWSVVCRVTSTASISLAGNRYSVDEALRFDPEDLTRLDVYWEVHPAGQATPFILGRHVHRQVPQAQPPTPLPSTGVDYLGLVLAAHDAETLGRLAFRNLLIQPPVDGQPEEHRLTNQQVEHQPNDKQPAEEHRPEEDHEAEDQRADDNHHLVDNEADDAHHGTEAQSEEDHSA